MVTYGSQIFNFEGKIIYAQRCGAGRTIGEKNEASWEMNVNQPYKTRVGYKLYANG